MTNYLLAHRTLIARKLKGLEDFISFSSVHWHLGAEGKTYLTSCGEILWF